jgi:hypothetical protein
MARSAASNRAEQCPLCPNTSDFDLLSDGKRIIDLDSEISDGTFHFRASTRPERAELAPLIRDIESGIVRHPRASPLERRQPVQLQPVTQPSGFTR